MLTILLFFPEGFVNAGDYDTGGWDLAKRSNGISIYYRWVTLGDSVRAREMRAEYIIDTNIPSIIPWFELPGKFKEWAIGIKECKMEIISESAWITYSLMNYPWPFKKKDLVTQNFITQTDSAAVIHTVAIPDYYSEKSGVERMKNYIGTWNFSSTKDGKTVVEYLVIAHCKSVFPRFIQDPVILKLSIKSLTDLKQLAEKQ